MNKQTVKLVTSYGRDNFSEAALRLETAIQDLVNRGFKPQGGITHAIGHGKQWIGDSWRDCDTHHMTQIMIKENN